MAGTEIRVAQSDADYAAFAQLIRQYVDWLRSRYQDDAWFINEVLGHQDLEAEITNLRQAYGPPQGTTFVAVHDDGHVCGAGAYRRLADGACEMKRLFVPDEFHGLGIGRALCQRLISAARAEDFPRMRLDTGRRLTEAIGLYQRYGFQVCEPYYQYPERLMPYLIFMELDLTN